MQLATENRLKSVFLSTLIAFCVLVPIVGAVAVSNGAVASIWLSVSVAAVQVLIYFVRLYVSHVPRTSVNLVGFTVGIFMATMYSIFTSYRLEVASVAPLLALVCMAGWMAYVGWYSNLGPGGSSGIKLGKRIPSIDLEDYDGNPVNSEQWLGQKRLILFYRGNWCPICTAQVNELSQFQDRFDALGVKYTFISPQAHDKSRRFANRTGMNADFLVDKDNRAAAKLGIVHKNGLPMGLQVLGYDTDVPKPTVFVIDENGKVVFADLTENYRLRPLPSDILKALKS
jgi:peroxiredoxin